MIRKLLAAGLLEGYSSARPRRALCVPLCANKEGVDLTALARRIPGAFNRKLGPPVGPKVMQCLKSPYPVAKMVARLSEFMTARGLDVLAPV